MRNWLYAKEKEQLLRVMVGNGILRSDVRAVGIEEIGHLIDATEPGITISAITAFIRSDEAVEKARDWATLIREEFAMMPSNTPLRAGAIVVGSFLCTKLTFKYSYNDLPEPWNTSQGRSVIDDYFTVPNNWAKLKAIIDTIKWEESE